MPVKFKTTKIAERAESDPLLFETLRDFGKSADALAVVATASATRLAELTDAVTGTGTTGFIPKFAGGHQLANSLIWTDGTNTGVGTTAPTAVLTIGDDGTTCLRMLGSTSGYIGFRPAAAAGSQTYTFPAVDGSNDEVLTTNGGGVLSWTTKTGGGAPGLVTLNLQTGATQTFSVTDGLSVASAADNHAFGITGPIAVAKGGTGLASLTAGYIPFGAGTSPFGSSVDLFWDSVNGRLGVGTNAPTDAVHISRTGSRSVIYLEGLGAGGYSGFKMGCVATGSEYLTTVGNTVAGWEVRDTNDSVTRMVILDDTGYVGIGTTAPTELLEVAGIISSTVDGFKFPDSTIQTTAAVTGLRTLNLQTGATQTFSATDGLSVVSAANNHAIGITGPIAVAKGGTGLATLAAGRLPFGAGTGAFGSSANLFWDSVNGRLGLGTSTPATTLEVAGIISSTTGGFKFPDSTIQTTAYLPSTRILRPEQYGGVADGKFNTQGSITSGAATLTLSGGSDVFAASDVGKSIVVEGAGASGGILVTTIAGYTSPTVATLTANASTTAVLGYVHWGTNNTTPFASLSAAVVTGCRISMAPGLYWTTGPISVAAQYVTIAGAGQLATQIVVASTTANCIEWSVTGAGQVVRDLGITGMGGKMTAGAAIAYTGSATPYWGSGARDIRIDRYYDGWTCASKNAAQYEAGNLMIHRAVRYGVYTNIAFMLHGGQIYQDQVQYAARFSISNGGTTVTAGSSTFTSCHVGDNILIAGAVSGGTVLRARITAVASTTSCTIGTAATATVASANGAISPRMEIGYYQQHAQAYLANLDIIGGRIGILIYPTDGEDVFYFSGFNILCDSQEDIGLQVAQAGSGRARDIKFTGSWFSSSKAGWDVAGYNGIGAYISTGAADTIEHVTFTACEFVNSRSGGLFTQQVQGVTVNGCLFENSGAQQANLTYGRDYVVTGNRFTHETYGSNNSYCLDMLAAGGAINVTGNVFRGFTIASTVNVTHNGTSIIVANNAILA